ncbi:uncharacterized protein [Pagrus major]|uniref:uncharacterized protein n=1 Tax=Pagrus major TaxID=143350 RepID=UPI003CC8A8CC
MDTPQQDISFFRVERENVLRRGLQVSEALPVQSQADIVQRELDSCLSLEYTPESLPPLLHQFFTDRSYHLAQIKYLLMLRWRRFCRHSGVIETLYPHYKDQVSYLTCEYEDAVQRARRLSVSRDKILTGRGNAANLLTQDDVVIYLRWLVCHLHSVQTVHNFLRVLHYIPACERKEEPQSKVYEGTSHKTQHAAGAADNVPLHTVHLEEFLPELQALIAHFHLSHDPQKLRTTADEMELFSTVWREFRTVFRQQEQMKTFPQYDGTEVKQSQWGRKSASLALRKEADWIPFIQVKPKRDPWQQKLIMKLKEKKSVDELLKMHSRFLQVPDLLRVAAALKAHAAHVADLQPAPTSSSLSQGSKTKRHKISEIWTSIYSAVSLTQETHERSTRSGGRGGHEKESLKSQTKESYSFEDSLQLLGLDESLEGGSSDPIVTRGAYLSLIHLRHLKLRQLKRISLGLLNYLRSLERTLTFDLAGLQLEEGELCSSAEETGWMNAAGGGGGGGGEAAGLGSLQFSHNTPVDCKVHCSEFMEFAEVENLHDFYSVEGRFVHTQDQRGFYIVYDVTLKDLEELEREILLVGSCFIQRNAIKKMGDTETADVHSWAGTEVDRVAVLLDLWTCETEFLESKVQLLNCYYEAYQHAAGTEERFELARVVTDIMHSRPQLDLNQDYFVQAYRAEIDCLRSHQQLIRDILDNQIDKQRQYLERIWRDDHKGSVHDFGRPPNYIPKHQVSLGGSSPALMNVFLLEVHPSLCLASAVYHSLVQAHTEICQLHRATSTTDKLVLRQKLLQRALQSWNNLASPGAPYSSQIQKDNVGLSLVRPAEETDMMQGREKQLYAVETFSKLLELVTIRHRLLESASETAHLAQLYRNMASELGFNDFHLYLRPVQFEVAEQKDKVEQRPVFITAILEDDSSVDRFSPSHLPLSIQELDENQIGRFSFSSEEAVLHLMNRHSVENLQVTLACQVTQKNALISAVKLVCLCRRAESVTPSAECEAALHPDKDLTINYKCESGTDKQQEKSNSLPSEGSARTPTTTKERLMEAFVSIQLEKVGLRDEMLNSFMKKKQAVGGLIKTPEEAAAIKRGLVIDFLRIFSSQISQYCVRAQIVAYYFSLTSLLDNVPIIRQSHFMIGRAGEPKVFLDSGADLCPDPRTFQRRPQQLLSADGKTLLNLWFIPHFSQVLHMFKTLSVSACTAALHHTLQIVSALHDIIYYLVSFSRLGNTGEDVPGSLAADWGGTEGIGAELLEIQRQVDRLPAPSSPETVGRLLQLRRQVLLLQFDAAVRHLIREAFLSSGDVASYQSVSDNMATALPLLSDSIQPDMFSLTLPVPPPLEARGHQAQMMYPWRSFMACQGLFPLPVWDVPPIEDCMQLCLSGLSDRSRLQANAAVLGVSLLMEDVLNSGGEAEPVRLHGNRDDLLHDGKPNERDELCLEAEAENTGVSDSTSPHQDPIRVQSVLKGFLLLMKQLQVFKESWARRRLGVQMCRTPSLYQQFVKLYRAEIIHPSMRALAQHMGTERDYELLLSGSQSLLSPPGASEVDVKTWQLHKLLESCECDMIRATQRRINTELTLVVSERTRQDTGLPTDLWKKAPLKYSLSPERPQIVETFIQQLMEGAEEAEGQLRVSHDRLQQCLTHLGCSLMERERRSFLLYSQFYEQILQQETQLLHQREQDLKNFTDPKTSNTHNEVAAVCRGMMLEVSALQARVAHLEQEKSSLEEKLSLTFKERYDPLVRHLFSTCIQLKARLDEYRRQMEQDVSEMVNRVRGEGVDRIIKLKKTYGCTKDNDGLTLIQIMKEEVHELQLENRQLDAVLCKLKALSSWRQLVNQEKLQQQLLQTQQREIISHTEALRVKMTSEEEVVLLQEELEAVRKVLARCQAECSSTKRLLSRKTEELQVSRHQSAQEARSRQELDSYRVQRLEQMKVDVEDRERQLRELSQQLDRGSRMNQLQRQRSAKEIRQVRGQLQHELSLKHEAFQQVDKLQSQVNDMEAAFSRSNSTTGQSRTYYTLSVSRLTTRSPSAGLHRAGRQQSAPQLGSLTNHATLQDFAAEPRHQRAETARSRSITRIDRPKADPTRLRVKTAETTLPDL